MPPAAFGRWRSRDHALVAMVRDMTVQDGAKHTTLRDKDVTGFFVRCYATGRKSFFFEYRDARGRMQTRAVGSFPIVSVKDARNAARGHAGAVVKGHDPAAEKREEKRTAQSSLSTLLAGDGPYERDLQARHMVNQRPILSALRRGLAKLMVRDVASLTRQVGDALMMRPGDQSLACRCSTRPRRGRRTRIPASPNPRSSKSGSARGR